MTFEELDLEQQAHFKFRELGMASLFEHHILGSNVADKALVESPNYYEVIPLG